MPAALIRDSSAGIALFTVHHQQTGRKQRVKTGQVTAFELAETYETLTVKKLDGVIFERSLAARAIKDLLSAQVLFLGNVTNGIEKLDLAGVKRVRADVEEMIARKPGEDKKAGNVRGK